MEERYPRNVLIDRCPNRMNDIYIYNSHLQSRIRYLCHIKNIYICQKKVIYKIDYVL